MSEEQTTNITKKKNRKILIIGLIGIVVVVALAAVFIYVSGSKDRKLKDTLQLAENYLNELDYEKAITAYEDAINIDSKCVDAYIGIADIYVAMSNEAESSNDYETAIKNCDSGLETLNRALNQENDDSEKITVKINEIITKRESLQKILDEKLIEEQKKLEEEQKAKEEEEKKAKILSRNSDLSSVEIGETVTFGHDKKNSLTWIVLDKQNDKVLLLEENAIKKRCYSSVQDKLDEIYGDCFFDEELSRIVDTELTNTFQNDPFNDNPKRIVKVYKGESYQDPFKGSYNILENDLTFIKKYEPITNVDSDNKKSKVFLLSYDEAISYGVKNVVLRNLYCVNVEEWESNNLSETYNTEEVAAIDEDGNFITYDADEATDLRPAIWVSIN